MTEAPGSGEQNGARRDLALLAILAIWAPAGRLRISGIHRGSAIRAVSARCAAGIM